MLFNYKYFNISLLYKQIRSKLLTKIPSDNNNKSLHLKMEVDKILDKLNDSGWESLTQKETELLISSSREIFDDCKPN